MGDLLIAELDTVPVLQYTVSPSGITLAQLQRARGTHPHHSWRLDLFNGIVDMTFDKAGNLYVLD